MFKRAYFLTSLIVFCLAGCELGINEPIITVTAVVPPSGTPPPTPTMTQATITTTPSPVKPSPTPTSRATATSVARMLDLSLFEDGVFLYPYPQLYAGDKTTFQVLPYVPDSINPGTVSVAIFVNGVEVGRGALNEQNLAGDTFGLVKWVWDTTGLAGEHLVRVVLDPDDAILAGDENPNNNQIAFSITVYDRESLPAAEANATWVTADTACCHVHVVSGTAAYRDLPQLLAEVETAVQQAALRLSEEPRQPLDIYFLDRVIGQGGYAGSALVVSYLDRDYASIALQQVLVHEAVHVIDRQFAPQRIALLAEGLAVWASGGHYKPENVDQQAAALLSLNQNVPLADLANNFYPIQHEIGYLQAASFVTYLIDNHGWSRFRDFYSDVTMDDAPTIAESLNLNLQVYYGKTLAEMETEWLAYLAGLPKEATAVTGWQTTLTQYDTMREYQRLFDPTAYFLNAWLPYPDEVREKGNPADLTRHPQSEMNITLEVMLQAAGEALQAGQHNRADVILASIERVLNSDGLFQDPLALSYRNIIRLATVNGYQVQKVDLADARAKIWVTDSRSNFLVQLDLALDGQNWIFTN